MDFDGPSVAGQCLPTPYYAETKMAHQPNLKQRLEFAVSQAEEKLAAVKRAKEIFDKHPDLEELLNIMQKSHF